MTLEDRERIRAVEVQIQHLVETVEHMSKKVDEVHGAFMQAKGAQWVLVGVAALAGFLSGKVGAVVAALLPK
jgi:predicted esterase YcpF (UPF0227 family)